MSHVPHGSHARIYTHLKLTQVLMHVFPPKCKIVKWGHRKLTCLSRVWSSELVDDHRPDK